MDILRRTATLTAAASALAAASLATAPAATADSYKGCAYPRVCFYLTDYDWNRSTPTASYRDVTPSYQNLGSRSRGANWVVNTRNDDRASLRYTTGSGTRYLCLPPDHHINFPAGMTVTGIRIDTAATC
ncbi:hypothetical protein [Streptomyces zingiberis]|uniref:Peptidase inhibitor family I36 protein n=1 Tax=Streptomyces zingiberis TaxID=2053010 RepID=A0ABX1BUT2_9ACTN|nr:hypothetical protein [Streptomyces zingiberis]NJQ00305.1 hypothetical protein [Streptomyces zingiberis]